MVDWDHIARHITAVTGARFSPEPPRNMGGGCINSALKLVDGDNSWFVKFNRASLLPMFEAESLGLEELGKSNSIRVPKPLCTGTSGGESYIVMEHITLGRADSQGQRLAGRQLAALHRTRADDYGWHRDNTIGSTHQPNNWTGSWIDFWREHRLGFQLQEAARNGYGDRLQSQGAKLLERFPALIDHDPQASLLHGDLWGGNLNFDSTGQPVIYDPATYYGDREAEIAMTELFGGFAGDFYAAYNEAWPLDAGYRTRKTLYNLYHILNHLNLFGTGYLGQAQNMLGKLLAEI